MRVNPHQFGVINLNKPSGMTSRDAVNVIQKIVKPIKVGHCGTLDPMATGVLLVCLGQATRLASYLQDGQKIYRGIIKLGMTSDTDDITGNVLTQLEIPAFEEFLINEKLRQFVGKIMQVPPDVSAVHVQGQRAYDLARQGKEFELTAREIDIYRITVDKYNHPDIHVTIYCGAGTYIRSIARDLGTALGCGALLSELKRIAVGPYIIEESVSLESIKSMKTITPTIRSTLPGLSKLNHIPLSKQFLRPLLQGKRINAFLIMPIDFWQSRKNKEEILLTSPDNQQPLGICEYLTEDGTLQSKLVFSDNIQQYLEH